LVDDDDGINNDSECPSCDDTGGLRKTAIHLAITGLGLDSHDTASTQAASPGDLIRDPEEQYKQKDFNNIHDNNHKHIGNFATPFFFGLSSGLLASISLYPFDFVRGGVLKPGLLRILSAGSTVPYAGALFGLYFSCRDSSNTSSQAKWAVAASTGALLAEVPLDHAKRAMLGSTRFMLIVGLMYVPFSSMMLMMYDKAAIKFVTPYITQQCNGTHHKDRAFS